MAFSDSNSNQITLLTREIATLTATLQREKQRRAAIASHAKEVEHRADTAEIKLKQVQYANKKLEEELTSYKENQSENRAYDAENAELKSQVAQLRDDLIENQALQQELLQLHIASINATPTAAAAAAPPKEEPAFSFTPDSGSKNHSDVDYAMKELAAIVPQYRASILALQGRIAVLNKQLEQVTAEKNKMQQDAARWRNAAQRNEACFADVAVKLHTQEAASLASKTSSQQLSARLEAELATLKQQYAMAEKELKEARNAAQQAQQAVNSQQTLLSTQSNAITRLETTVKEQQEDIIAALDLVCHRNGSGGGNASNTNQFDIDAIIDFLDATGVSTKPETSSGVEEGDWTIPADSGAAAAAAAADDDDDRVGDEDSLETWLHNPFFEDSIKNNTGLQQQQQIKMKKKVTIQQQHAPTNSKNQKNSLHNSAEMADLANDIAALRDALQRVF